jgi:hypothetical protein
MCAAIFRMKTYVHARLSADDRAVLEELKKATGRSESELLRRGLRLVRQELEKQGSALQLAGTSVGKFSGGPKDLARNKRHLAEFGR